MGPVLQEEPTTKKSFGFDPSRLRSRLIPKIDPRGKQAEDSKSPAVSVSVSHSVSSTEPDLGGKVGAPVVTQQPDPATPSVGKLGAGLHEDEKAEKAVLASSSSAGDAIIQMRRQKKRRRGQTRPGAIKSTDEEGEKTETEKKVTTSDTRRTSVPRLRLKTSLRPRAESPDEERSG